MGESEPKENFNLTHGVCAKCKPKARSMNKNEIEGILPVRNFFLELQLKLFKKDVFDKDEVLKEARRLKIKPGDLLAGVMQPLLYEIGQLYLNQKIAAVQEHKFSMFIKALIAEIQKEMVLDNHHKNTEVLLACANGNYHEFGISMIDLQLREAGVKVESIVPGLPPDQLFNYAHELRTKVVGISVSMESQIEDVKKSVELFNQSEDYHPLVIIGGFAIRNISKPIPGATLFTGTMPEMVETIIDHVRAA